MFSRKYLVLLRNTPGRPAEPGKTAPSPEPMQRTYAAYAAWKERFKDPLIDMGDKLRSAGRVVPSSGVADGPNGEAKDLVVGFMIVSADTFDGAVEVVRACPAADMPGVSMEVRAMAGRSM